MLKLRDYQQQAIIELYDYIRNNKGLNPCLVLPTGAGKSVVIAKIATDFFVKSNGKLLMLTHVSELIEQNYHKVRQFVNPSDVGLYSAGLGKQELHKKITFAGIQSIYNKKTPDYKVIMVDECHLISVKEQGIYRTFIDKFPDALVIGLTATPYRMDNGYINVGDNPLFNDLIIPDGTTIPELIAGGYLSTLKSKVSDTGLSFKGVKKSKGDFNEKQVGQIVNHFDAIEKVIADLIERTKDFKHVLVFCSGIDHTVNISQALCDRGERSFYVHGKMSKADRKMAIDSFKGGILKYLCNPNILTTGFDYPDIDCVVMLRPTYSVVLYVQMAGRGLRLKSHTDHCVILDYVGNIERHGTIINPNVKDKKEEVTTKICPKCLEVNDKGADVCIDCGYDFNADNETEKSSKRGKRESSQDGYALSNQDIMYDENAPEEIEIIGWNWQTYTNKADGKRGIVGNFNAIDGRKIPMFLAVESEKAQYAIKGNLKKISYDCYESFTHFGLNKKNRMLIFDYMSKAFIDTMNENLTIPKSITVKKDGNFYKFLKINY
jgi:DNA repair protein RadD